MEFALRQCESIYEEGFESVFKVAKALKLIKKMKLYQKEYESFESYCNNRLKLAGKDVDNIINIVNV